MRKYDRVKLCDNQQLHIAFMAGYDQDTDPSILDGPAWIQDILPPHFDATDFESYFGPNVHTTALPVRGVNLTNYTGACEDPGLNILREQKRASGAFCCREFPEQLNRNPCNHLVGSNLNMMAQTNAFFFAFLKTMLVFKNLGIPAFLYGGGLLGIARSGDFNCQDHDIDLNYDTFNAPPGVGSKDIHAALESLPLKYDTQIDLFHVFGGDLSYDSHMCVKAQHEREGKKPYQIGHDSHQFGTSSVRIHAWGCNFKETKGQDTLGATTDCGIYQAFGRPAPNFTDSWMVWRGFKIPVVRYPYFYLEEIDQKWLIPAGFAMHNRVSSAKRAHYVQCIVDNGGMSRMELTAIGNATLIAHLETKCGHLCDGNCAWDPWEDPRHSVFDN